MASVEPLIDQKSVDALVRMIKLGDLVWDLWGSQKLIAEEETDW